MTDRAAIVARILIEERWAHLYARGNRVEASDRSALSIAEGGLGRRIHPATLKARVRSYDAKKAQRLAQLVEDERERRQDFAEAAVARADDRVAALAGSSDPDAYSAALRAYWRAEEKADRLATEHVPLARWMRDADELDVALKLLPALRAMPRGERALFTRSLALRDPLAARRSHVAR